MVIFQSSDPLAWGALDLPLLAIDRDWHGDAFQPPAGFALAIDPDRLWLLAAHSRPADLHPDARPGRFQPELWRHDVAELFLADPASGRYLELNLAPNSAWWSCLFQSPRVEADGGTAPLAGVESWADLAADGSWLTAMAVPLDELRRLLDFGKQSTANVCMILGSPEQRFLSVADLGGGEPDYHRPDRYPQLRFQPLDELPDLSATQTSS